MLRCNSCNATFETNDDIINKGNRIRVCEEKKLWFNCPCGSTFFIKSGNFDWFSPTLLMPDEARKVYSQNDLSNKIPSIHTRIMSLQRVIENPKSNNKAIKEELEQSPALALLTLKIASGLAQDGSELNNIEHAVALLGRNTLSGILLSASLVNMPLRTKHYRTSMHWKRALVVGQTAREVFARLGCPDSKKESSVQSYLFGCFYDIGKLLASICFPEKVDELVLLMSNPKVVTSWQDRAKFLGMPAEHVLGEIAVAMWGLPQELADMFQYYQDRSELPSSPGKLHLYECIEFASIINYWIKLQPHEVDEEVASNIQAKLGLDDGAFENLINSFGPAQKQMDMIDDSVFA